jgi:hypothetical protein
MLLFIRACKIDHFESLDARERICYNETSYLVYLTQDGDKNRILMEKIRCQVS